VVALLKERGLYDDALVVVTSDHGEELGEHGRLLRVPLLVKLPGNRRAGTTAGSLARGIDVAPTLLRALDLPVPASFEGRDLLARGGGAGPEQIWSGRAEHGRVASSLRTPRWKLAGRRLFDLEGDPGEHVDVAATHPDVTRRLEKQRRSTRSCASASGRSATCSSPDSVAPSAAPAPGVIGRPFQEQ